MTNSYANGRKAAALVTASGVLTILLGALYVALMSTSSHSEVLVALAVALGGLFAGAFQIMCAQIAIAVFDLVGGVNQESSAETVSDPVRAERQAS